MACRARGLPLGVGEPAALCEVDERSNYRGLTGGYENFIVPERVDENSVGMPTAFGRGFCDAVYREFAMSWWHDWLRLDFNNPSELELARTVEWMPHPWRNRILRLRRTRHRIAACARLALGFALVVAAVATLLYFLIALGWSLAWLAMGNRP
ncbi:MAG: hypothetical protein AB1725_04535 [Armatimonadota bacterium]